MTINEKITMLENVQNQQVQSFMVVHLLTLIVYKQGL